MFQFSPIGTLALVSVAACWALALLLFRVSTSGSVGRKLSFLLLAEGVTLVSTGFIDLFLTEETRAQQWYPQFFQFEAIIHTLGDCVMLALYPPFLAVALQTKLVRPFAKKGVRTGISLASAVLFFIVIFGPIEVGGTLLYLALSLLFTFALVASIHAWHTATGIARSRAGVFALAFGIRDICWGFVYAAAIWMIWKGTYSVVDSDASSAPYIVYALGTLLAVPLIAYGILRTQMFDIDLRIRWTIKQSTLAATVLAIIFVLSEAANEFLSSELGTIGGLLGAAIVVFFLAPLQRFAERVATVAMPNTQNTPEYASYRKMQVYESAVAEAKADGGISDKERKLLNHLRDSLGISPVDAESLERDLQTGQVKGAEGF